MRRSFRTRMDGRKRLRLSNLLWAISGEAQLRPHPALHAPAKYDRSWGKRTTKRATPLVTGDCDPDGCSIAPEIICEPSCCIMADASATATSAWVCSAAGPNSRITITFAWCRYVSAREMDILVILSRSGFDMGAPPICQLSKGIRVPPRSLDSIRRKLSNSLHLLIGDAAICDGF